jgi:hypothetical protein
VCLMLPTSRYSPGSEDSTSPSKPTDSDASARSSSTQPALPFSNDGGPTSPAGEMSTTSPLLPTPTFGDAKSSGSRENPASKAHDGISLTDAVRPDRWGNRLTSSAGAPKPGAPRRLAARVRRGEVMPQVVPISSSEATRDCASPSATPASEAATTTRGTSGPSSPVWLASFDPDGYCWRTSQATLALELERFSETLPRWGMTRRGSLYALPISALPTDANDGSASLNVPTPTASDAVWADRDHSRRGIVGNHNLGLVDWVKVLPTPKVSDHTGAKHHGDGGPGLREVVTLDLRGEPTPPPSNDGSE